MPLAVSELVADVDAVADTDCVAGGVAPDECVCVPVVDCDGVPDGVGGGECVPVCVPDGVGVFVGVVVGVGFRHSVPGCCVLSAQLTLIVKPYEHAGELVTPACMLLIVLHAYVSVDCSTPPGVPQPATTSPPVYC